MSHLTERELVDVIDGVLPADRRAHLDACAACRGDLASLRETLDAVLTVDVPEPSPLFWEHFSARVCEGVNNLTVERAPWYHAGLNWKWAAPALVAIVLVVAGVWRWSPPAAEHDANADVFAAFDAGSDLGDADGDEAWAVVRTIASETSLEDVTEASLATNPGSAERAAQLLTLEERRELYRLLEAETRRRPGA